VIFHCFAEASLPGTESFWAFLPLALAGFTTAVIFGVQWFVGLFFEHDQIPQQDLSISQGASR
jgi:hypothetical protein